MRKLAAASMIIGVTAMAPSRAQDLHVPLHYSSIQAAIDAAVAGGHIVVAPGVYHENLLIEKAVTLVSSGGAEATVIDGRRLGPVIVARGTGAEVIEISGFTIVNGFNEFLHPNHAPAMSAGMFIQSVEATITDNVVRNNLGCIGAGIATLETRVVIEHNVVADNPQNPVCFGAMGGGIFVRASSGVIASNEVSGHVNGGGGAGIAVQGGEVAVLDNVIRDNRTEFSGGGIMHILGSGVIRGNLLQNNSAQTGGAIHVVPDGKLHIADNVMIGNDATLQGSSVELVPFGPQTTQFVRNEIRGNSTVELIVCQQPYRINRSNELVNESGPELSAGCSR
jgi:hypothetical protein